MGVKHKGGSGSDIGIHRFHPNHTNVDHRLWKYEYNWLILKHGTDLGLCGALPIPAFTLAVFHTKLCEDFHEKWILESVKKQGKIFYPNQARENNALQTVQV